MGYNISTLDNVPIHSGYYFLLLGKIEYTYGRSGTALYHKFDELAQRIGKNSAIIKSYRPSSVARELIRAIKERPWFREAYLELLDAEPALVIMKPHPSIFKFGKNDLFVVVSFRALDQIYDNDYDYDYDLVQDIIALASKEDPTIFRRIRSAKEGVGVLRQIKGALILEPNFYGLGVNLRKLFEDDNSLSNCIEAHFGDNI